MTTKNKKEERKEKVSEESENPIGAESLETSDREGDRSDHAINDDVQMEVSQVGDSGSTDPNEVVDANVDGPSSEKQEFSEEVLLGAPGKDAAGGEVSISPRREEQLLDEDDSNLPTPKESEGEEDEDVSEPGSPTLSISRRSPYQFGDYHENIKAAVKALPHVDESLEDIAEDIVEIRGMLRSILKIIKPDSEQDRLVTFKDLASLVKSADVIALANKVDLKEPVVSKDEWSSMIQNLSSLVNVGGDQSIEDLIKSVVEVVASHRGMKKAFTSLEQASTQDRVKLKEEIAQLKVLENEVKDVYTTVRNYFLRKNAILSKTESLSKLAEKVDVLKELQKNVGSSLEDPEIKHLINDVLNAEAVESAELEAIEASVKSQQAKKKTKSLVKTKKGQAVLSQKTKICFICETSDHFPKTNCPLYPNALVRRALFKKRQRCVMCGSSECNGVIRSCAAGKNRCRPCGRTFKDPKDFHHHPLLCPKRWPIDEKKILEDHEEGKKEAAGPSNVKAEKPAPKAKKEQKAPKEKKETVLLVQDYQVDEKALQEKADREGIDKDYSDDEFASPRRSSGSIVNPERIQGSGGCYTVMLNTEPARKKSRRDSSPRDDRASRSGDRDRRSPSRRRERRSSHREYRSRSPSPRRHYHRSPRR